MFTRKSGLQMLLSSMGIEINPDEIMAKYAEAKDIMPKLALFVQKLDERLSKIEETQSFILTQLEALNRELPSNSGRVVASGR